jgi:hypothetical protein
MPVFNDTHEVIKQLAAEGGMSERGAEILETALNRGLMEAIATKADIAEVKGEIAVLRVHVDNMETRLSNKLYVVGFSVVLALGLIQHYLK